MILLIHAGAAAYALNTAPQAPPYFYCQPWGPVREYVTSSVDCRFAVDDKGVPEFIEGLTWKACGERNVDRWDRSVSPPVPHCKKASTTKWTSLGSNDDEDYSFDPASARRAGSIVTLRLRTEAKEASASGAKAAVAVLRIDCDRQTSTILSAETYDSTGKVLRSRKTDPGKATRDQIFAGTAEGLAYVRLCNGRELPELPRIVATSPE